MRSNAVLRAITVLGLGLAGLVGGHALGYAVAVPDDIHRTALLEATGHGYLPSASRFALMLGIAAVVAGIASGYLHRPKGAEPSWRRAALRLSLLQCGAFVGLEISERLTAGASLNSLSWRILAIGLVTQALVGVVLALLVVGLRRLGAALRLAVPIVDDVGRGPVVAVSSFPVESRTPVRDRVRGPPALVA